MLASGVVCRECKKPYSDAFEVEIIKEDGKCLSCDKLNASQYDERDYDAE